MLHVSFSVSTPAYRVSALELPGQTHPIQANFEEGNHVFTSPDFKLGTIHTLGGQSLVGRFSFRYSYDSALKVITVCGTDYASADGMTLATMPEGTDKACFVHASQSGFAADEAYANGIWNYHSQLLPGAAQVFKDLARDANEALVEALKAQPELTVQVREKLPRMPLEDYLNLSAVYRSGNFLEMYDPTRQYESTDRVYPFESAFGGTVHLNPGEEFSNVIGSTNDPKIASLSWVKLWANQMGFYPSVCTSYMSRGFACNNNIVGGHVILGRVARVVAAGSNSVYIFPICSRHNSNNTGWMSAETYLNGIWLINYFGN